MRAVRLAEVSEARAASRDQRRQKILLAARRLLAEQGLAQTGLREIAAAAGATTGAIYPHFNGREDILAALLAEVLAEINGSVIEAGLKAGTASPARALKAMAEAWFQGFRPPAPEAGLRAALLAEVAIGGRPELASLLRQGFAPMAAAIRAIGRLSESMAEIEAAALHAQMLGLLQGEKAGSLVAPGRDAPALLAHHLDALIARLQW
jgi:AcrR family transcriptional regulator